MQIIIVPDDNSLAVDASTFDGGQPSFSQQ